MNKPARAKAPDVVLAIKVTPRAARNEIVGWHSDALKVRLQAPPVDGKANAALLALLAETLQISQSNIEIVRGETSRQKWVRIKGLSAHEIQMRLESVRL